MLVRIRSIVRFSFIFLFAFVVIATFYTGYLLPWSPSSAPFSFRYYSAWKFYQLGNFLEPSIENYDDEGRPFCIIPNVELSKTIWVNDASPFLTCNKRHPRNPVFIEDGSINVMVELQNRLKSKIQCEYLNIEMEDDFHVDFVINETAHPLPHGRSLCPVTESGVFKVICRETVKVTRLKQTKRVIFEMPMRCIAPKFEVTERIRKITKIAEPPSRFDERLNIVLLGLDSVSRYKWLDQMLETVNFTSNELGGVTFEGYNIVGDGTTAAILGLTTGHFEEELPESRRGFTNATEVDDFPFIWRRLRDEAGYATLWHEDQACAASFNYRLMGFKNPPVDHYGRIFQLALESKHLYQYPKDSCLGSSSIYEEMMSLYRQFFAVYPEPIKKFAFIFSGDFTHTSAGISAKHGCRLVDTLTARELKYLHEKNYLNHTALILFSDHGSRFQESRNTERGKLNERLPYLSIVLPKWFRDKYHREMTRLEKASKRLTTPFDLHATLTDLGGLRPDPETPKRGISFFDVIPLERTCETAGISPHWCTCLSQNDDDNGNSSSTLQLNDTIVTDCVQEFVKFANWKLLAKVANECYPIESNGINVTQAKRLSFRREFTQFQKTSDGHGRMPLFNIWAKPLIEFLQISFQTQPGSASWEVTFQRDGKKILVDEKQISRTNRYGSAPKCVQDRFPNLRQFCVCKSST